jgi:hypothetical protein
MVQRASGADFHELDWELKKIQTLLKTSHPAVFILQMPNK